MTLVISKEVGVTFPRVAWGIISQEQDDPSSESLRRIFPYDQEIVAKGIAEELKEGHDNSNILEDAESINPRGLSWDARRIVLESTEEHDGIVTALYIDVDSVDHLEGVLRHAQVPNITHLGRRDAA